MTEKAHCHHEAEEAKAETPEASHCSHHGHEAPAAKPAKAYGPNTYICPMCPGVESESTAAPSSPRKWNRL